MPNGLLICSSMVLLPEALCNLLTSDNSVALCVTVSNWLAFNQAKRIVCRTVSRFPISSWETLFRISSANFFRRYWINFWKIPQNASFDLEPFVYKSLKKKLPELREAIDDHITPEQTGKLKEIKAHYENLESRKAELEELTLVLAASYQQELTILQTAPGIRSDFTAIGIISEIGTNMEAFHSAKHLYSWAGLTPTNNESARKKKAVWVSKNGCYIKPLLVQCANAVVTSKKASWDSQQLSPYQKVSRSQESQLLP